MPAARDDYLLRLIQQAAAALRNLRTRLGGGAAPDEVSREADDAIGMLLGPQRNTLERLDAWSAANLLGDPDRLRVWSDLVALQADLREVTGDVNGSAALRKRAEALKTHARS